MSAHPAHIRRRLLRNEDGAAALEFALLAMPFIVLLTAIIETALVFLAQQVLQTATIQAGRMIMTGQAQTQGMTASQFQQAVCNNGQAMFDCSQISVNVQTFGSFSSITTPAPIVGGNLNLNNLQYNVGTPGDIVLVQAFYNWPVITGLPGLTLSNNGNMRLLEATTVFRNEPY